LAGSVSAQQPERDAGAVRAELDALRQEIARISESLQLTEQRREDSEQALREVEATLASSIARQRQLGRQQEQSQRRLSDLQRERSVLGQRLQQQQGRLADQVRASYRLGQSGALRLLFGQADVHDMARSLTYFRYVHRARAAEIRAFRDDLSRLADVESSIQQQQAQLQRLQDDVTLAIQNQQSARVEREQVLQRLVQQRAREQRVLARLDEDRQRLEDLLQELLGVLADIPPEAGRQTPFADLRGRLPWPVPVSGRQSQRQGWVLTAPAGTRIEAIAEGRVVFADWLRGFGLLVIVDHGDGYMSLYGHADALYRQVGEWVAAGDALGEVGSSGGQQQAGLYFGLRHQGKALTPGRWLRSP
jgi:septal ring factor EnvC (AmiA/AmiB activator)